jgi:hypothetical protein
VHDIAERQQIKETYKAMMQIEGSIVSLKWLSFDEHYLSLFPPARKVQEKHPAN